MLKYVAVANDTQMVAFFARAQIPVQDDGVLLTFNTQVLLQTLFRQLGPNTAYLSY